MIRGDDFFPSLLDSGFRVCSAVPCSFLTPIINAAIASKRLDYIAAAHEGEAVAIASGAWLNGRSGVVMCQNSGLGNTINALATLAHPFRIPMLIIVTWRGGPTVRDEPQHRFMGSITPGLLELMDIPWLPFPTRAADVGAVLARARAHIDTEQRPFALIMGKGDMAPEPLRQKGFTPREPGRRIDRRRGARGPLPRRIDVLKSLLDHGSPELALIASTGKCGRELFTLADREQHFYQVGSMGCASALGLGAARYAKRRIVVLDGDGAALMNLGNIATIGAYRPENYIHVLLDNGVHDSTGGQATVSPAVDFPALALACGYRQGIACDDRLGWEKTVRDMPKLKGPVMIHMRIAPGSIADLPRPNVAPEDVARRFRRFLNVGRGAEKPNVRSNGIAISS